MARSGARARHRDRAAERRFKKQHVMVVRGLTPGQSYDFFVLTEDPANPAATGTPRRRWRRR